MSFAGNELRMYAAWDQTRAREHAWLEVLAVAGATALAAQVRIPLPFTPVPVTLQTLVVMAAPFLVGAHRTGAGMALYAVLGFLGAPVFALGGATFGYIVGFIAAPFLMARCRSVAGGLASAVAVVHLLGVAWLSYWTGLSPVQAFALGSLPFLAPDAIKAAAVCAYVGHRSRD